MQLSQQRALARQISALERGEPVAVPGLQEMPPGLHVIGVTGPPGAGKSVLVGQLAKHLSGLGHRVGVLAVDPSSPVTGGAILGDRLRMPVDLAGSGVFIRSLASRGALGGLAAVVPACVQVLAAAGFECVVIETVGVGQNETDILTIADTVLLVQSPGAGDDIQGLKAGILEIGDVFAVNKCDLPGSQQTVNTLREVVDAPRHVGWRPPVICTTALAGEGVVQLVEVLGQHRQWLERSGELSRRRLRGIEQQLRSALLQAVQSRHSLSDIAARVINGEVTLQQAIAQLVTSVEVSKSRAEME